MDILCFYSVLCLLCLYACLFICALLSPAGKGLTSWLSFVVSTCKFITFLLVSWVKCDTWLYRFLIFAPLLTLIQSRVYEGAQKGVNEVHFIKTHVLGHLTQFHCKNLTPTATFINLSKEESLLIK